MNIFDKPILNYLLLTAAVLALAWILSRILKAIINHRVKRSSADLELDSTTLHFLKNAVDSIILILAIIVIFYLIPELKAVGISLFAGAGILAAIIGFASQQAFANIIGGIFIVIFKPFKVGDIIKVDTHFGMVEDITLRHTVINGLENRRIVVPNSTMSSETILNSSLHDEKICIFLEMGISYDSDIDKALQIMVEQARNHPSYLDNRTPEDISEGKPDIITRVTGFGDSSVNLRAQIWSSDAITAFSMKCDLHKSVKEQFDIHGIEIPFPYRTIVYKQPVAVERG